MRQEFQPLEPRVIKGSRGKGFLFLVLCIGFVGTGILLVRHPPAHPESFSGFKQLAAGWGGIIVFGYYSYLYVLLLINPHVLMLDRGGFELRGGRIRSPKKILWQDVQEFRVVKQNRTQLIGYSLVPKGGQGTPAKRAERRLPSGWTLSVENMVDLLNIYRLQVLAREPQMAYGPNAPAGRREI